MIIRPYNSLLELCDIIFYQIPFKYCTFFEMSGGRRSSIGMGDKPLNTRVCSGVHWTRIGDTPTETRGKGDEFQSRAVEDGGGTQKDTRGESTDSVGHGPVKILTVWYVQVSSTILRDGRTHHRPRRGWRKREFKALILAKEERYGDLKCVAGVGGCWHM